MHFKQDYFLERTMLLDVWIIRWYISENSVVGGDFNRHMGKIGQKHQRIYILNVTLGGKGDGGSYPQNFSGFYLGRVNNVVWEENTCWPNFCHEIENSEFVRFVKLLPEILPSQHRLMTMDFHIKSPNK